MPYNIQCVAGHVFELPEGSDAELEQKCAEREEQGFLDALCISENECLECVNEHIEHLRRELRLCNDVGCPMNEGHCANGCLVARELEEAEKLTCLTYKTLQLLPVPTT